MNEIHEIALDQIRPASWNPPARMDPAKVKELAASIKKTNWQAPGTVRPIESDNGVKYELVCGHRRFAAQQILGNPFLAEIREMDDEQAIIFSGIENLQREDLGDIEEAEYFQTCAEKYGESAVKLLSEKLSVSPRYVRKRIEFLCLPDEALHLWRSNVWHVGHMEQLLRMGDRVSEFLAALKDHHRKPKDLEAHELRDIISKYAVPLKAAYFDKADCKACPKNTDHQKKLFDDVSGGKGHCQDQVCFKTKQQAWLDVNWRTCEMNRYETQAAVIGDWNTETTGRFGRYDGPAATEKCKACQHLASIVPMAAENNYRAHEGQVCMGPADCYAEIEKTAKKEAALKTKRANAKINGQGVEKDEDLPRVAWHGEYYRQEFYHQELPRLMACLAEDDPRRLQVSLAMVVYSNDLLTEWFCEKAHLPVPGKPQWRDHASLSLPWLLAQVKDLSRDFKLLYWLAEAMTIVALDKNGSGRMWFSDTDRQTLATFLDIDWQKFQVTPEYLKKKTKAELLKFIGFELELLQEAEFITYLQAKGMPTGLEKLAMYKKGALVDLVLNCGVDLHGRLPKEIASLPELQPEPDYSQGPDHSEDPEGTLRCDECNCLMPKDKAIYIEEDNLNLCPACADDLGYGHLEEGNGNNEEALSE